ncbi:hypothetical protein JQU17_04175 [Ponticoccus sp. SC2-23]|uniref:hypothetical protein n=1 Tax=Alexandriicola marinus TaxID=2081710 RepID=UPI000FD730A5|nr:hypothetical protein [Alexandriicola marinus]MBM1219382.1 hypothetical protein [Ponticoccus sp. SC6-9]MBM1223546.1 hypothetical protein [Ponticoccus sp. SC6-15]MBM1229195.1 hypothetical protein [Ponticoccus sp. SC6-38]MBM1232512.1 hypothetical protein [Ponticoccus sp. SC6-45]MBM1237538.1 hypothetical protein [Ponticoccus sp. SC6-49]MBM1241523.1 hypothetical protein [Ponticoccus sp. SC2-64]MBM1246036.1 hypothetical protein [Ponticoccus sp. SC6-42]MBM1250514.1 hypothetical protein [Pontico
MFRYSALIIPFALSSCGILDNIADVQELESRAEELEAIVDNAGDIDELLAGNTESLQDIQLLTEDNFAARTGTTTYEGFAGWSIPDGNQETVLTADAVITANFDDEVVTTEFTRWLGARLDANDSVLGGAFQDFDARGDIEFTNGEFVLDGGDISFVGDISGELEFQGDDYGIDGSVEGSIANVEDDATGDLVETIAAGAVDDTVFTINGEAVEGAEFGFGGEIVE